MLIIEDDNVQAKLLQSMIQLFYQYEIIIRNDCSENDVKDFLIDHENELKIFSVESQFPTLNGIEIIRLFRKYETRTDLKIIMTSGNDDEKF